MKSIKTSKGITLIALIITIVVLLILAGVAIGTLQESNIIGHAGNAARSFNQAKGNEISLLEKYEKEIEEKLPSSEEVVWGEYGGALFYIGTSKDLKVTSDTIKVQEITINEETMKYTRVEGKIKTATFADYEYMVFLTPDIETIDFGNKLSSNVTLPCFYENTTLKTVKGLEGITSIPDATFEKCTALSSIEIPNTVIEIGEVAFRGCINLTELVIPEGVVKIELQAFEKCINLKKISIPSTVTSIGFSTFLYGDATETDNRDIEIIINRTRTDAEATLGTNWIPEGTAKIIYTDQEVIL